MLENEEFEEVGNYDIKEEVSKEKADKLEGLAAEQNSEIEETEDDQQYQ
jgi:hypothetical protein